MASMDVKPRRRVFARIRISILSLGGAWLCAIAGLWDIQGRMVYPGAQMSWRVDPAAAARMGFAPQTLRAPDLPALVFFVAAPAPGMPVLVFFHGNGDIASSGFDPLEPYLRRGYGAVIAESPGSGGNPGRPTERSIVRAGRAIVRWAAATWPGHRLVLWGESLGTGVAIAARDAGPVAGLVLDSPFTSIREIAQRRFPAAPIRLLLRSPFDSLRRLATGPAIPALVLVGGRDGMVPPDMGPQVAAATRCPATVLRTFADVSHMVERHDPTGQADAEIGAFLERVHSGTETCERLRS